MKRTIGAAGRKIDKHSSNSRSLALQYGCAAYTAVADGGAWLRVTTIPASERGELEDRFCSAIAVVPSPQSTLHPQGRFEFFLGEGRHGEGEQQEGFHSLSQHRKHTHKKDTRTGRD